MVKRLSLVGFLFTLFVLGAEAQQSVIDTCPYSPQHKTSLACLIPDLTQTGASQNLSRFNTTVAQVIGQLPLAAPVSGFVLAFDKKLGIPVEQNQNLGSVLTERGNTVGRHKVFIGFTYQRFVFQTIDGAKLSNLPSVYQIGTPIVTGNGFTINEYGASHNSVSANLSQYAGIVAFGLTDRIDVSVTLPFERVSLAAGNSDLQSAFVTTKTSTGAFVSSSASIPSSTSESIAGSATGFGDVLVNAKGTIFNGEKSKLALGMETRFPTGDEYNLLGTGAYGVKPYLVFSRLGRITPHANVGYQWNGFSNLYINPCHYAPATANTSCGSTPGLPTLRLPDSVDYSGGADIGIVKRLTVVADFVGQHYFNSPRVTQPVPASSVTPPIPGIPIPNPSNSPSITSFNNFATVQVSNSGINLDNLAMGLKWNPVGKLIISANALIRLDDGSLRPARFVPLVGLSYRFGN
ncbi:MAG TPA: transporter [Candidatus Sulfotelmatobacter sp.]